MYVIAVDDAQCNSKHSQGCFSLLLVYGASDSQVLYGMCIAALLFVAASVKVSNLQFMNLMKTGNTCQDAGGICTVSNRREAGQPT